MSVWEPSKSVLKVWRVDTTSETDDRCTSGCGKVPFSGRVESPKDPPAYLHTPEDPRRESSVPETGQPQVLIHRCHLVGTSPNLREL